MQLQYRAAAAAAFFTQFFYGMIIVMVYHAFYASSTAVQPMSLQQAVTYTWLGQVTFRLLPWNSDREVLALVRSGNLAYELCRPLDVYLIWYCRLVSIRVVPAMLSGIPLFSIALLLPGSFGATLPVSAAAGAAWAISILLAVLLSCALSNLATVTTLWTIAGDGMQWVFPGVMLVLSGSIVPLAFFPDGLQRLLRLLPFSGLVDTPFRFYLGTIQPHEIFSLGLLQLAWTAVFVLIGSRLLAAGMKRVVIQGG